MTAVDVLKPIDFPRHIFVGVPGDPAAKAEAITKFGLAELNRMEAIVRSSRGDNREPTLDASAEFVGQLVAAGVIHGEGGGWVKISLLKAVGDSGLIRDNGMKATEARIAAGIKLAKKQPRKLVEFIEVRSAGFPVGPDEIRRPAPHSGAVASASRHYEQPVDADSLSHDVIIECSREPQNDTGNGKRLLKHFGKNLLHVRSIGWHTWAGTHWEGEGGSEAAIRYAQVTAARIALEADVMTAAATPHAQKLMQASQIGRRKYSISSGNTGKINGMLDQAMPHRIVTIDDLDADKLALNVANGTIRFVWDEMPDPDGSDYSEATIKRYRVEIAEHNRSDNITKVAPVEYDPDAICPAFDKAVKRFLPIARVREFVQRYHGYALTGLTGEQCLVFNYGTGSNWKSTFVEIVARIMGPYCATIAFESLSGDQQRSGSQATPDLARLPGARLVRASEPERGVQFKESLIKSLTGGEPMLVRNNYQNFFEFRPTFKMILSGNHKPEIGGVDHGIWRRIRFVTWPVTITEKEKRQMDDVIGELWAERSGILNWLITGALDYLNNGLQTPPEVIDGTAEYRDEMDPVGAFVGMCIETVPSNPDGSSSTFVSARQMYDAFVAWAVANAVRPWREKNFSTVMSQKGFAKERHKSGVRYLNVLLKDVPEVRRRHASAVAGTSDSHDPSDVTDVAV
jgi:putative DNA primase/helicase